MTHTSLRTAAFLVAAAAAAAAAGEEALTAAGPGYRGVGTGGVYPARGLLKSWPTEGPKLLWKAPLGNSAGPVTVFNDRVYCVAGGNAWLHTFTLDGKPAGKAQLGSASWKRFGFTRSAPLIAEGVAVGTTPNANIYAVDLKTMATRWQINAWKDFGSGKGYQGWGLPESPILHGVNVVFNPVSRDDDTPPLVAVDIRDPNQIVWQAAPGIGKAYSASDCSSALFRHKGRNLIVSPTWCYLLCVDADTGKTLWEIPAVGPKTLTPVYHDGTLLVAIQREIGPDAERQWPAWAALPLDPPYRPSTAPTQPAPVRLRDRMKEVRWTGEQMALLRLSDDGADAAVQWVRQDAPGRYSHAVFLGGRIYCYGNPNATVERSADGTLPPLEERAGGGGRSALLCLDAATGKVLAQVPAEIPGHVVSADGMLYAVDLVKVANNLDPSARPKLSPRVRLLYPTPKGMEVTGEKVLYAYDEVPELRDVEWEASVPPVVANGRLFVKFGPLAVFDIRGAEYEELPAAPAVKAPPLDAPVRFPTTNVAVVRAADVPGLLAQLGHRLAAHRKTAAALLARVEPSAAADMAVRLAEVATTGGAEVWPAQRAAAEALRAMGASSKAALPALQKALPAAVARRDGTAARLMLDTIRGIDEGAAAAVARPLGELLSHKDPYVQYAAAGMLSRLGPQGAGGAAALARAVQSDDAKVWHESAAALHAMGPAAGEGVAGLQAALLKALEAKQAPRGGRILSALAQIDPQGVRPAVPRIAAMLADKDVELRRLAARMLQQAGAAGAEAVPALVAALRSDDAETAKLASAALNALKTQGGTAAALAKVLDGDSGEARAKALGTLAGMGPAAAPAVPALIKLLGDPNLPTARAAARALSGIGIGAKAAVEPLTAALKRDDPELARAAAAALGAIGPAAAPAADALLAMLNHRDATLRAAAVDAVARTGRSPAPALLDILKRERGPLQQWAAGTLAALDQPSDDVVAALAATLDANDAQLTAAGLSALRIMGPKAAKAVPALLKHARGSDARAAGTALSVIAQIGPAAKPAVGELIEIAKGNDAALAAAAVRALAGIGPGAESAVKPLVALSAGAGQGLADAIQRALDTIKTTNVAPTAKDVAVTCPEGGSVVIQFPASDVDDVAGFLRVGDEQRPSHGTLDRGEWAPLPTMVYRSQPGFAGTDTFTWHAADRSRGQSAPAKVTVTVLPDTTAPTLREAFVPLGATDAVWLAFDEPLAAESAENVAAYAIDGGVKVLKARLDGDSRRIVALTTTPLAPGTYKVSAKGIRDMAKAANAGGGEVTFAHRPLKAGLKYVYGEQAVTVEKARVQADFDALELKPKATGVTPKVAVPVEKPAAAFTLRLDGAIEVPRVSESADYGEFTLTLTAAGSASLLLDGRLVGQAIAGRKGEAREMTLAAGMHAVTIFYSHSGKAAPALSLSWSRGSGEPQEVPPAVLHHLADP